MGFLSDLLGGKKVPKSPGVFRDAASNTKSNAELLQSYIPRLSGLLNAYLDEYPEYADRLSDLYDRSLNDLENRYSHDIGLQNVARQGETAALRRLLTAGDAKEQARSAREARSGFSRDLQASEQARAAQEAQFGQTARLRGRDSAVNRALAFSAIDDQARTAERNYGENLRLNNLGLLQQYGSGVEANLAAQRAALVGRDAARQSQFGTASNLYGGLASSVDNANTGWDSAFNAADADWQARVADVQAENARRNRIFSNLGTAFGNTFGGQTGGATFGTNRGPATGATGAGNFLGTAGGFIGTAIGGPVGGYFGQMAGNAVGDSFGSSTSVNGNAPGFRI